MGEGEESINNSEAEPLLNNNEIRQDNWPFCRFYNKLLSRIGNALSWPFEVVKCCFIWQNRKPQVSLDLDSKCEGCNIVVVPQCVDQENDCFGKDPFSRAVNGNSIVFKSGLSLFACGFLFNDLFELSKPNSRAAVESNFLQVTFWYSRSELIGSSQCSRELGGFGIPLILLGVDILFRVIPKSFRLSCFKLFDASHKNTDFLLSPDKKYKYIFASTLGFITSYITSASNDLFSGDFYKEGKNEFLKKMIDCLHDEVGVEETIFSRLYNLLFCCFITKDLHKIIYDLRDGQINRLSDDIKRKQYKNLRKNAVMALQELAIINPRRRNVFFKAIGELRPLEQWLSS
jgi:hypothetical protein